MKIKLKLTDDRTILITIDTIEMVWETKSGKNIVIRTKSGKEIQCMITLQEFEKLLPNTYYS